MYINYLSLFNFRIIFKMFFRNSLSLRKNPSIRVLRNQRFSSNSSKPHEITVNFDTKNKKGRQKKQVIVFTNSYPNKSILTLQGYVE